MANATNTTSFPPGYLEESRQADLYAASTITCAAATVAVILRFWARHYMRIGWWLDDWLILGAVLSAIGLTADFYWWSPRGFGKHIQSFGPEVAYYFPLGLFIAEMFYTGVVVLVKYAILALYWRLFKTSNIKIPLLIFGSVVTAWGIAVFLLNILQCIPTEGYWDKSVPATCGVNQGSFLFGISIPNIVTDVGLLVLPVPYILRLNMNTSQKQILCSLFLLGGFVCIASILRLVSVLQEDSNPDLTWSFVNQAIWASVETNFSIVGACLPCLRPVWLRLRGRTPAARTAYFSNRTSKTIGSKSGHSSKRSKHTMDRISDEALVSDVQSSFDTSIKMGDYHQFSSDQNPLSTRGAQGMEHSVPTNTHHHHHQPDRPIRAHIEVTRDWKLEYQSNDSANQKW